MPHPGRWPENLRPWSTIEDNADGRTHLLRAGLLLPTPRVQCTGWPAGSLARWVPAGPQVLPTGAPKPGHGQRSRRRGQRPPAAAPSSRLSCCYLAEAVPACWWDGPGRRLRRRDELASTKHRFPLSPRLRSIGDCSDTVSLPGPHDYAVSVEGGHESHRDSLVGQGATHRACRIERREAVHQRGVVAGGVVVDDGLQRRTDDRIAGSSGLS